MISVLYFYQKWWQNGNTTTTLFLFLFSCFSGSWSTMRSGWWFNLCLKTGKPSVRNRALQSQQSSVKYRAAVYWSPLLSSCVVNTLLYTNLHLWDFATVRRFPMPLFCSALLITSRSLVFPVIYSIWMWCYFENILWPFTGISRVDQLDVAEYSILLNKVCEAFFWQDEPWGSKHGVSWRTIDLCWGWLCRDVSLGVWVGITIRALTEGFFFFFFWRTSLPLTQSLSQIPAFLISLGWIELGQWLVLVEIGVNLVRQTLISLPQIILLPLIFLLFR